MTWLYLLRSWSHVSAISGLTVLTTYLDLLQLYKANALGMDIVETGHFTQILGRKASKKYLSSGVIFPFLDIEVSQDNFEWHSFDFEQ